MLSYICTVVLKTARLNIIAMAERLGIEKRLIVTDRNSKGAMKVPTHILNLIYNCSDVGLNTAVGEGWSLTNMEHAVTGAPQIVADNFALRELYTDCGLLIPARIPYVLDKSMTTGYLVRAEAVAKKLNLIYKDKKLYNELLSKDILSSIVRSILGRILQNNGMKHLRGFYDNYLSRHNSYN